MNPRLAEAEGKLRFLLLEIKDTPEFDRANQYVGRFTKGVPLDLWLRTETIPVKERALLVDTLTEILLTKDYSRLPGAVVTPVEPPMPTTRRELEELIQQRVRIELSDTLALIAKVLREAGK